MAPFLALLHCEEEWEWVNDHRKADTTVKQRSQANRTSSLSYILSSDQVLLLKKGPVASL